MNINVDLVRDMISNALKEDVSSGDITSNIMVPPDEKARARITVKEEGVVCAQEVAGEVFRQAMIICGCPEGRFTFESKVLDGSVAEPGTVIAEISGSTRGILLGERTALNFMQRLSGIATVTRKYVEEIEKVTPRTKIYDTRKTTPGLRYLEKYAVRCGGGTNHRMGLWDMVLVKDNHLRVSGAWDRLSKIREKLPPGVKIEVEVRSLEELREVMEKDVDVILLDNMSIHKMKEALTIIGNKCEIEVSGGIDIRHIRDLGKLGVDRISIGALTHSVKSLDISLNIIFGDGE